MEKNFSVLGRVRYKYAEGHWDEWYLQFEEGTGKWLSEDEGEFSIEEKITPQKKFTRLDDVELGDPISFGSWGGSVDEFDDAVCVGFQGELPEEFDLEDEISYAEGSGPDGQMFTVEEDEEGVHFYQGKYLSKDRLRMKKDHS